MKSYHYVIGVLIIIVFSLLLALQLSNEEFQGQISYEKDRYAELDSSMQDFQKNANAKIEELQIQSNSLSTQLEEYKSSKENFLVSSTKSDSLLFHFSEVGRELEQIFIDGKVSVGQKTLYEYQEIFANLYTLLKTQIDTLAER